MRSPQNDEPVWYMTIGVPGGEIADTDVEALKAYLKTMILHSQSLVAYVRQCPTALSQWLSVMPKDLTADDSPFFLDKGTFRYWVPGGWRDDVYAYNDGGFFPEGNPGIITVSVPQVAVSSVFIPVEHASSITKLEHLLQQPPVTEISEAANQREKMRDVQRKMVHAMGPNTHKPLGESI